MAKKINWDDFPVAPEAVPPTTPAQGVIAGASAMNWDQFPVASEEPDAPLIERAELVGRQALSSNTAGLSEPVISAAKALMPIRGGTQSFEERFDEDVARQRELQAQYPNLTTIAQVGGAFLPGGVAGGIAKVGGAAGKIANIGLKAGQEAGTLRKVIQGATAAGVGGAGYEAVRQGALESTGFLEEGEAPDIQTVSEISAAIGGGIPAARGLYQGGKALTLKALSLFGKVPEETIEAYVKNPSRINNAPTLEEVKDKIDEAVGALRKDVDDAVLTREQAQKALKDLELETNFSLK